MKAARHLAVALLCFVAAVAAPSASDRSGVYAKVDKVIVEPNAVAPQAIQVWGVFSIATKDNPNDYVPPARGYLYFKLPSNREAASAAVREWSDLKQVAGTGQIVSFGTRKETTARVRKAGEPPRDPDAYSVNVGVTKVRQGTDYPPVRLLVDAR